jgi:ubiquinone/menaquinone biosynthesis C-methylase UbiE
MLSICMNSEHASRSRRGHALDWSGTSRSCEYLFDLGSSISEVTIGQNPHISVSSLARILAQVNKRTNYEIGAFDMNECSTNHQPGVLRVLQTKEETKAFYDKIAKVYDVLAEHSEAPVRMAGLKMINIQPGWHVLEIGFGTGHSLIEIARFVGPSGKVFGIDLSEKMVEISRKRAEDEDLDVPIELSCGDALYLPYESESLDAVFMSFTLELFDTPEIPLVLAECKRVLKPGGRIVVVGMSRVLPEGLVMEIFEWTHRHFPNYLDCRPILVRKALEDSGFQILDSKIMKMWISVEVVCGIKNTAGVDASDNELDRQRNDFLSVT